MKAFYWLCITCLPILVAAQAPSKNALTTTRSITIKKEPAVVMKQYFFVMLTKGLRRGEITDTIVLNKIQEGHMKNITNLAEQGKLIVAGPFGDDTDWRGIFIFDVATQQEVEALLKTDPAIAAGRLNYEIHPWWTAKNAVFK